MQIHKMINLSTSFIDLDHKQFPEITEKKINYFTIKSLLSTKGNF